MTDLVVHPPSAPLKGVLPCPADALTVQLALLLGALGSGPTRVEARGLPPLPLLAALAGWGVSASVDDSGVSIAGGGLGPSEGAIDGGADPSLMAALLGVAAAQPFASVLDGACDPRALAEVAAALRQRGAQLEGRLDPDAPDRLTPPLEVAPPGGGALLSEASYELGAHREHLKVAALFSGLLADGPTWIHEPLVVSDRVERLLGSLGMPLAAAGSMLQLEPPAGWPGFAAHAPGDSSVGWSLLAAALCRPDSLVGVRAMAVGPCRRGLASALRSAGAALAIEPKSERLGEPCADVTLRHAALRALRLEGELGMRAGVALPVACVFASFAEGTSRLADLAADEPVRRRTLAMLAAFGVPAAWSDGALVVEGGRGELCAAELDSAADPALAMAATVLALRAAGPCRIRGAECIVASAPRFVGSLRALGATIDLLPSTCSDP